MKAKGKCLFMVLLLVMVVSFPGVAFAQSDEYGYNAQARMYKGTLENWDAFLSGLPPAPFDPNGTNIIFVKRKWDKLFDPMVHLSLPSGSGAWQKAELWEYLSGDQLGWTWHLDLEVIYSPNTPILEAIVLEPETVGGFKGYYLVEQKEWLVGPDGEKTVIQDFSVSRSTIKRTLHLSEKML
ncbi:MAG TPA: hypothetical protein DD730_19600 [Desulfosporosinus sp.]|jgi:hypothetical protein|nr:hypothetical protein [Desulfosporosinus sp.]